MVDYSKEFPNIPSSVYIDFEGNSAFPILMKTFQYCLFAIEDEIQINCGIKEWFSINRNHPLFNFHQIVENYRKDTKKFQSGMTIPEPDIVEGKAIAEALLLIWRLGTSIFALVDTKDRLRETVRLITNEFFKSEYVLSIARLFKLKGYDVCFIREDPASKTPDLLVNGILQVECKQKNPSNLVKLRSIFKEGKEQIFKDKPGIICIDLPSEVDLYDSSIVSEIERQIKGELNATSRVHHCLISQVKFITEGVGEEMVFALRFAQWLYANPNLDKLIPKLPQGINIRDVFSMRT